MCSRLTGGDNVEEALRFERLGRPLGQFIFSLVGFKRAILRNMFQKVVTASTQLHVEKCFLGLGLRFRVGLPSIAGGGLLVLLTISLECELQRAPPKKPKPPNATPWP